MAPPSQYLFVNKTSKSPSLSRNTGSEANLASKVNHHVQKSRFLHISSNRKSNDTSSRQSDCSSPGSSKSLNSPPLRFPDVAKHTPHRSASAPCPVRDKSRPRPKRKSTSSKTRQLSSEQLVVRYNENDNSSHSSDSDNAPPVQVLINGFDPRKSAVLNGNGLSARLRGVVYRYMNWAISASVSASVIKEGMTIVFQRLLTDDLHRAAFLAAATAHETRAKRIVLPIEEGPDQYRHEATRLISQYYTEHQNHLGPLFPADVFRLAMAEWLGGSIESTRIHFNFLATFYEEYKPQDKYDRHHIELVSTADLLLAIDSDLPTIMSLHWVPELPPGPYPAFTDGAPSFMTGINHGEGLMQILEHLGSGIDDIIRPLFAELALFTNCTMIDYAQEVTGPVWAMKRRLHGAMSQLQKMTFADSPKLECIRRTLILLMLLATTNAARRENRTNTSNVAKRLCNAVQDYECPHGTSPQSSGGALEPGLLLWIYFTGLAGAKEEPVEWDTHEFFLSRAVTMCSRLHERAQLNAGSIHRLLGRYMTFYTAHHAVINDVIRTLNDNWP